MTFLYPNVLYALILPALLAAAAWWLWRRRSRKWEVLVSPEYRRELVNAPATWHRVLPVIFAVLASIFAILSMARPVDGYTEVKEIPKSRNILIAIDCSRSMLKNRRLRPAGRPAGGQLRHHHLLRGRRPAHAPYP